MAQQRVTVVDVGAGYGTLAELLTEIVRSPLGGLESLRFDRYIAIDVDAALLRHATERAARLGIGVEGFAFDVATGEGLKPPPSIGDIVVFAYVITHLPNAEVAFREAARLAKPGAVVLVVDIAYANAVTEGDKALAKTIALITGRLKHADFDRLDYIAARHCLRRLSGLDDTIQHYGTGDLDARFDALDFVANFREDDPARIEWQQIRGGELWLRQIRRAYVREP